MLLKRLCLLCHTILLSGFSIETLFVCGFAANFLLNEPRPVSGVFQDVSTSYQVKQKLSNDPRYDKSTHINVSSFDQVVLLTGQVPDETLKSQAASYAIDLPKIRYVFNQITVSTPTSSWRRIQDKVLAQLVRAQLVMTSNVRYHHFCITTENGVVFMMGKADPNEANLAAYAVQKIAGVRQVTKLVEKI